MIRKFFILIALVLSGIGMAFGQTANELWFDQIHNPAAIGTQQGIAVCTQLRQALKDGKSPQDIGAMMPEIPGTRAVFLTIGDGLFPGRTYYAVGKSFRDAVCQAVTTLQAREQLYPELVVGLIQERVKEMEENAREISKKSKRKVQVHKAEELKKKLAKPGNWDNLRLDIVQATAPAMFTIGTSKLFLSSLCGLAFDVNSSFAFTAEQLTARCMIAPDHKLSVENSTNVISESGNAIAMKMWLDMASTTMPFRITLFETDSYYADSNGACRLFRAHPVIDAPEDITAPLEAAENLAMKIAEHLEKNGRIEDDMFFEWVQERPDGRLQLNIQAELVLTMVRIAQETNNKKLLAAAELAAKPVLKRIKSSKDLEPGMMVAVSLEDLEPGENMMIARDIVTVEDTALCCMTLMELQDALGTDAYQKQIYGMVRFLMSCQKEDGSFVHFAFFDDMKVPLVDPTTAYGRINANALAGLVFLKYGKTEPSMSDEMSLRADLSWRWLRDHLEDTDFIKEQHFNNWLMEFVQEFVPPIPENVGMLAKFVLAAGHGIKLVPEMPDEFGSPQYLSSMTIAARRTEIIMDFCYWLIMHGKRDDALMLFYDAWPLWFFQQQAIMTPATASVMSNPCRYLGFYRDNLDDYGFNLRGQVDQMLSCLAVDAVLKQLEMKQYLPEAQMREIWQRSHDQIDRHPLLVSPRQVITLNFDGEKIMKYSGVSEEKPTESKKKE